MTLVTIPRIVIAGTHSGSGKTTIASGIMAALTARGLRVQPFKVGPDFIDPSHHTRICGRISRNLDPVMMGEAGVPETFSAAARDADIAVIEGVMGLFDGLEGGDTGSTAHVAKILRAPVILVVDAKGASRSVHAMIRGFRSFDPDLDVAGVILNRIGSSRHRDMIAETDSAPVLGWVPWQRDSGVPSRHLGLVMAHESGAMEAYGKIVEDSCSLDSLLATARNAPALEVPERSGRIIGQKAVIGVASDEAFCFRYQDNLDRLVRAGAEIRFFSPMRDVLPEADALYFCGGYPEIHAAALESSPCRKGLRAAAEMGMPVYAECGGLLYLSGSLEASGKEYRMAGVLPARGEMTDKIQALGYVTGTYQNAPGSWLDAGPVRGHEFHYSRVECDRDAIFVLQLERGKGISGGRDGLCTGSAVGTYTHAYFTDAFTANFVHAAKQGRAR
ncbi:MAG: cobyrinate a,c-diamide synthase [Methanoregulaceae archaeon]